MKYQTVLAFLILLLLAPSCWAQKTFITITANDTLITSGEAGDGTYGDGFPLADYAEVISYNLQLSRAVEGITPTGGKQVGPVTIVKSIGASSVYLRQAWDTNANIAAKIVFFLPDPTNPSQSIEAYQVELSGGRITALKSWQNVTPSSTAILESVSIVFQTILWLHPPTGTSTEYTWTPDV